jgi:hypothetical protein
MVKVKRFMSEVCEFHYHYGALKYLVMIVEFVPSRALPSGGQRRK